MLPEQWVSLAEEVVEYIKDVDKPFPQDADLTVNDFFLPEVKVHAKIQQRYGQIRFEWFRPKSTSCTMLSLPDDAFTFFRRILDSRLADPEYVFTRSIGANSSELIVLLRTHWVFATIHSFGLKATQVDPDPGIEIRLQKKAYVTDRLNTAGIVDGRREIRNWICSLSPVLNGGQGNGKISAYSATNVIDLENLMQEIGQQNNQTGSVTSRSSGYVLSDRRR